MLPSREDPWVENQSNGRAGLVCFPILRDHHCAPPVVQCVNTVVWDILSSFLVVYGNFIYSLQCLIVYGTNYQCWLTLSWPEADVTFIFLMHWPRRWVSHFRAQACVCVPAHEYMCALLSQFSMNWLFIGCAFCRYVSESATSLWLRQITWKPLKFLFQPLYIN